MGNLVDTIVGAGSAAATGNITGAIGSVINGILKGLGGISPRGDYQRFMAAAYPAAKQQAASTKKIVIVNWFNGDYMAVMPDGSAGVFFNLLDSWVPTTMGYHSVGGALTEGSIEYTYPSTDRNFLQGLANALGDTIYQWHSTAGGSSSNWTKDTRFTTISPDGSGTAPFADKVQVTITSSGATANTVNAGSYKPQNTVLDTINNVGASIANGLGTAANIAQNAFPDPNKKEEEPNYMMYAMIGGAALLLVLLLRK